MGGGQIQHTKRALSGAAHVPARDPRDAAVHRASSTTGPPRPACQSRRAGGRQSTAKSSRHTLAASFLSAVLAEWKRLRKRRHFQPHCLSTVESPKYESNLNNRGPC